MNNCSSCKHEQSKGEHPCGSCFNNEHFEGTITTVTEQMVKYTTGRLTVLHYGQGGEFALTAPMWLSQSEPRTHLATVRVRRGECKADDVEEAEANAHRLALCWNSHDAMLEALRLAFRHSIHRAEGRVKLTAKDQATHESITAAIALATNRKGQQ